MSCDFPLRNRYTGEPCPCGKCPKCIVRITDDWIFRVLQQDKVADSVHWVTFTYDDAHLPRSSNGLASLCKRDLQLYFKRLRKTQPFGAKPIKYFGCGEYGSRYQRPHYHVVIFNSNPHDIEISWHDSDAVMIGNVFIDPRPFDAAAVAYTCGYMNKKRVVPLHRRDDRLPEYRLMSTGLGLNYLSDNIVNYHTDDYSRGYVTLPGGKRSALPRYYVKKMWDSTVWDVAQRLPVSEIRQRHLVPVIAAAQQKNYDHYVRVHGDDTNYRKDMFEARRASIVNFQNRSSQRKDL